MTGYLIAVLVMIAWVAAGSLRRREMIRQLEAQRAQLVLDHKLQSGRQREKYLQALMNAGRIADTSRDQAQKLQAHRMEVDRNAHDLLTIYDRLGTYGYKNKKGALRDNNQFKKMGRLVHDLASEESGQ